MSKTWHCDICGSTHDGTGILHRPDGWWSMKLQTYDPGRGGGAVSWILEMCGPCARKSNFTGTKPNAVALLRAAHSGNVPHGTTASAI